MTLSLAENQSSGGIVADVEGGPTEAFLVSSAVAECPPTFPMLKSLLSALGLDPGRHHSGHSPRKGGLHLLVLCHRSAPSQQLHPQLEVLPRSPQGPSRWAPQCEWPLSTGPERGRPPVPVTSCFPEQQEPWGAWVLCLLPPRQAGTPVGKSSVPLKGETVHPSPLAPGWPTLPAAPYPTPPCPPACTGSNGVEAPPVIFPLPTGAA